MAAALLPAPWLLCSQRPPSPRSLCLAGGRAPLQNYALSKTSAPGHATVLPWLTPSVKLCSQHPRRQVGANGVARRMLYDDSGSYVLIEPGEEEVFVNLEELQTRLKHWLEQWPGKELPPDLARYGAVEEAVDYLSTSACELDLGGGLGCVQWFQVRLESDVS